MDGFIPKNSNSDTLYSKIHIFYTFILKIRRKVFGRTSVGANLRMTSVGRNFKSALAQKKMFFKSAVNFGDG